MPPDWSPSAPMSLSEFTRQLTGKSLAELSAEDSEALRKIFGWGAGPGNVKAYMEEHELASYAEMVKFVERRA